MLNIGIQFFGGRGSGGGKRAGGGGSGGISGANKQITSTAKSIQSELGTGFSLKATYSDTEKGFTTYSVSYNGNPVASSVTIGTKNDGGVKITVNGTVKNTVKSAAKEISPKKKR